MQAAAMRGLLGRRSWPTTTRALSVAMLRRKACA